MMVCCRSFLRLMTSGILDIDRMPSARDGESLTVPTYIGDVFDY